MAAEVDGLRRAVGDGSLHRIPAHLTLVPPVNVAEDRLPDALALVRDAAAASPPVTLDLGPPGTFLPANAVLYLSVGGDVAAVRTLRERVLREPLARATAWAFVPHVTLADEAPPEVIDAALAALSHYRVQVRFDRAHLLRQRRDRVWEPIAEAPLRAPAVVGRGGLELELTATAGLDPEAAAFLEAQGAGESPFAVTARRGRQVVGAATGTVRGSLAQLDRVVVDPAQQGQGVGPHLLAAVESLAREAGCHAVVAEVAPGGRGEGFLRSRGWTADARPELRLRRLLR